MQGGPAAGLLQPVQAGSIPFKNASSPIFSDAPSVLTHGGEDAKLMAFNDIRDDSISFEQPQDTGLPTDNQSAVQDSPISNTLPEKPAEGVSRNPKNENMTEDFATALESFEQEQAELAANEDRALKGTVVSINSNYLVVDIGLKSEGVVPVDEAKDHDGNVKFQPGDPIDVMVEKGHTEEGYVNLSYQKAQRLHVWDEIEKAHNDKVSVKARVIDRIKGGLTVDILGARAFLPGSQVDVRPVRNLDALKGQDLEVRVIKVNKKRGNIVVSRKQILDEEVTAKRDVTMGHLEENAVLTGTVKNLTDYGAFVDLGGIDGLLHITDMSWGRLTHPRDLVNVGDQIQVKILKFDRDKQRVSLGFKQLTPDPWLDASERYPIGARVHGRVISVTDYGAFIELEQGIEGLVHVSEMTWSKRM